MVIERFSMLWVMVIERFSPDGGRAFIITWYIGRSARTYQVA